MERNLIQVTETLLLLKKRNIIQYVKDQERLIVQDVDSLLLMNHHRRYRFSRKVNQTKNLHYNAQDVKDGIPI